MFALDLAPLEPGVHHLQRTPSADDLDLSDEMFSDIAVDLIVDHGDQKVLVTFQAHATAHLQCDRTLRPYEEEVQGSYAVLFADRYVATPGVEDDDSTKPYAEVRELEPTQHIIDLTEDARDTLRLALPQRRVAPGAEDEELQTTFGAGADGEASEDDIDPRWEALRALRSTDEGE